jgi:lipoprotein-anchoring transpeptidase ErfK/SrfK
MAAALVGCVGLGLFFLAGQAKPTPALAQAAPAVAPAPNARIDVSATAAPATAPAAPVTIVAPMDAPPLETAASAAPHSDAATRDIATPPAAAAEAPAASQPAGQPSTTRPSPGTAPASAAAAFAEARKLLAAADLVGARRVLNSGLAQQVCSQADMADAKRQIAEINKLLMFSTRRFPADDWMESHKVEPGEMLAKIAAAQNVSYRFVQRINGLDDPRKLRAGSTIKVPRGPFHAVVTKHAFTLDVYLGAPGGEDSLYVTTYRVGLGSDDSTPTGKWIVEPGRKVTNPKWVDVRTGRLFEPDDPQNPLGEYWIGLLGTEGSSVGQASYGIHATIEPDTIGKQASLGCIRLLSEDVAVLFDMLTEGKSTVIVLP